MEVTGIRLTEDKKIQGIRLILIVSGQEFEFAFRKNIARQLMRAIFLRLGVHPNLKGGSGVE